MAYMSQEKKQEINASLKKVMPKSWNWSLSVSHHSTIVLTIQSAPVDLCTEWQENVNRRRMQENDQCLNRPSYVQVNPYYPENQFDESLPVIEAALACLYEGHWDHSDSQTDYFHCAWYVNVNLGRWNKPFQYLEPLQQAA